MLVYEALLIAQLVSVPTECVALANREGFKAELTEAEAKRANRRLKWLRVMHPFNAEIKACRDAVERMKG